MRGVSFAADSDRPSPHPSRGRSDPTLRSDSQRPAADAGPSAPVPARSAPASAAATVVADRWRKNRGLAFAPCRALGLTLSTYVW